MEFSDNAKYWLRKLGNFGVTSSGKEIKGWALLDGDDDYERVYFSAEDLRKLANAANEVADKLDGGLTQRVPDALRAHDMGEVAGVKLTYVKGNVFATPAKRR